MKQFLLRSFVDFITNPLGIASVVCMIIGLSMMCLAKNITRTVRKTKDVKVNDRIFIVIMALGIIILLVGLLLLFLMNDVF